MICDKTCDSPTGLLWRQPRVGACAGTNKSGNGADVAARRAVFLDFDLKDAPDTDPGWSRTVAELDASGAALVVHTGNGYHSRTVLR
jgi:hypothetical protein